MKKFNFINLIIVVFLLFGCFNASLPEEGYITFVFNGNDARTLKDYPWPPNDILEQILIVITLSPKSGGTPFYIKGYADNAISDTVPFGIYTVSIKAYYETEEEKNLYAEGVNNEGLKIFDITVKPNQPNIYSVTMIKAFEQLLYESDNFSAAALLRYGNNKLGVLSPLINNNIAYIDVFLTNKNPEEDWGFDDVKPYIITSDFDEYGLDISLNPDVLTEENKKTYTLLISYDGSECEDGEVIIPVYLECIKEEDPVHDFKINIRDGFEDYDGEIDSVDRRIKVGQSNIADFNSYATGEGDYAGKNGLSKHYVLAESVDLTEVIPTGNNWTPIGESGDGKQFTGTFDGNYNTIKNFTFIDAEMNNAGLFGYISGSAEIRKLGLVDVNITGGDCVGGIAGVLGNNNTIKNCFVTGSVNGKSNVGGIVGMNNYNTAIVENCYNEADVKGSSNNIGGIAGYNIGTITNCYNTGDIESTGEAEIGKVGGIAGNSYNGITSYCYNTGIVKGYKHISGIIGYHDNATGDIDYLIYNNVALNSKIIYSDTVRRVVHNVGSNITPTSNNNYSRSDMVLIELWNGIETPSIEGVGTINTDGEDITESQWDIVTWWQDIFGTENSAWEYRNYALPILKNMPAGTQNPRVPESAYEPADPDPEPGTAKDVWDGTTRDTDWYNGTDTFFDITKAAELAGLAQLVNDGNDFSEKTINLKVNIDLAEKEWTPIGTLSKKFNGSFNGNGHVISKLKITDDNEEDELGLFGVTDTKAVIERLGLEDVYIEVDEYIGAIAGENRGVIKNCYATGTVKGKDAGTIYSKAGGITGWLSGTIENCYSTVSVRGYNLGGLAGGNNWSGTIINSVALNDLIEVYSTSVGRIGCSTSYDYFNNYAKDSLNNANFQPTGLNNLNGDNISYDQYTDPDWWKDSSKWNTEEGTAWDFDTIWEWGDGLPKLRIETASP